MSDDRVRDEGMIAALKRERAAYVARGDDDRVSQVDEQLKHYGYEGEQDAVVDPTGNAPAGRTGKSGRQRTASPGSGSGSGAKVADKSTATDGKPGQQAK
ncbi:hypothetical protein [Actinomadura litoris]|uniref:hypothetical protein n=1 Tax=Actinomadura litoris TaxID=2678616 RepID=UPI001FA7E9CB|nr:hypothetical protein [Actinomadura litoris]